MKGASMLSLPIVSHFCRRHCKRNDHVQLTRDVWRRLHQRFEVLKTLRRQERKPDLIGGIHPAKTFRRDVREPGSNVAILDKNLMRSRHDIELFGDSAVVVMSVFGNGV